ncbi:MAG: prolyl oligopeptidase family serine peptidase, partial [Candidatus Binatia bacterium]
MNRWRLEAAALALAVIACNGGGSDGGSRSSASQRTLFCDSSSWVAGVTELCDGHLVYRDYVYDDYGADNGLPSFPPITSGILSPAAGDARYAGGAENTADLVRLEMWLEGDEVKLELELNTLYEEAQTKAAIAIDTDGSAETGGGGWPGFGVSSEGWDEIHVFDRGDPTTNLISGSFPRPPGATWKLWAVTAKASGTVMNVAFRGPDERADASGLPIDGAFWEDRQAAALGAGDVTRFAAEVAVADLESGVTRDADVGPGFHQRVYTSKYTLPPGEGISPDGVAGRSGTSGSPCEQAFHYLGKYQPYGVYVPDQPGPHGMQLVLHGCSANHSSLVNRPGMQRDFGEDLNRILVVPLGRGPTGFYSDISERDVLDVMGDVVASYEVDEEQVFAGGYSMGGYGTIRLAALHPDLFAGAVNWVGFTGSLLNLPLPGNPLAGGGRLTAGGNAIDFVRNLRHVPIVNLYAAADELVHVTTALALQARFAETDVVHDFYLHPVAEHLTLALLDDWSKEAAYTTGRTRVHNPARVTFRTHESFAFPEYELAHDRAYWVSDVHARGDGYVDVDVTSRGCGQPDPATTLTVDAGAGPLPLLWTRQSRRVVGETNVSAENRIEAT